MIATREGILTEANYWREGEPFLNFAVNRDYYRRNRKWLRSGTGGVGGDKTLADRAY